LQLISIDLTDFPRTMSASMVMGLVRNETAGRNCCVFVKGAPDFVPPAADFALSSPVLLFSYLSYEEVVFF
jgi:hypothetical protein